MLIERSRRSSPQWAACCECSCRNACIDHLLKDSRFGFDISSMSAIIGTQQYVDYFNNPHGIVQGGIGAALAGRINAIY